MCLLISGPSVAIRKQLLDTHGLVDDIYANNPDGLGVMFSNANELVTTKLLPKDANEARAMINSLPDDDRELAVHWRMKTHGHIDLTNCHPYSIDDRTAMMHNGILHTGNKANPALSDTFHFIQDYLLGIPADVLHKAGFIEMLGKFISNNRFAIMSADGRLSVVNKHQGVSCENVWYSNTYAWEPAMIIPGYGKNRYKSYVDYKGYGGHLQANAWAFGLDDDRDDEYQMYGSAGAGAGSARASAEVFEQEDERDEADDVWAYVEETVDMALYQFDTTALGDLIEEFPFETLTYIFTFYEVSEYSRFDPSEWDLAHAAATAAWVDGDTEALLRINEHVVAEAIIQCCDWDLKPHAETPADKPTLSLVQ
jgi:hypothetical protein